MFSLSEVFTRARNSARRRRRVFSRIALVLICVRCSCDKIVELKQQKSLDSAVDGAAESAAGVVVWRATHFNLLSELCELLTTIDESAFGT